MDELDEQLQTYLVAKSAEILKCDQSVIIWENDIDEYGFTSMETNQLCLELNEHFSIAIQPALFLEVTSLEELSRYVKKNYFEAVENKLL